MESEDADAISAKYGLLHKLGEGAFGEVWLVRENSTGAQLALKMVRKSNPHWQTELAGLRRFRNAALLRRHPRLLQIFDIAENERLFYYTMEPADNLSSDTGYHPDTLAARLENAESRLPGDEISWYAFRLLEGIEALHQAGLAHCDIKPSNIIFVGGEPKLADIGLAACRQEASHAGTPGYLPADGQERSAQENDFYALGRTLYRLLGGEALSDELPDLSPEEKKLRDLCYAVCTPGSVRTTGDFRKFMEKLQIHDPENRPLPKRRNRWLTGVSVLLLLALGAAGYAVTQSWNPPAVQPSSTVKEVQVEVTSTGSKSKDSTRIYSFFSPNGGAEKAILREIGKTSRSIRVAVYFFTEPDFADALIAAKKRGATVEVIVDKTQENRKDSMVPKLLAAGIPVFIDEQHRIMHNKFSVIDNETVITGSQNWTDSSEKKNAENTLIIRNNRYLAGKYLDTFEQLKTTSHPATAH